jgi:hypothetical protein
LIPIVLWLFYDFISLKNDVNVVSNCSKPKYLGKRYLTFLVAILKVTDQNSRIRIRFRQSEMRIRTKMSRIRYTGFRDFVCQKIKMGTYTKGSLTKRGRGLEQNCRIVHFFLSWQFIEWTAFCELYVLFCVQAIPEDWILRTHAAETVLRLAIKISS